MTRHLLRLSVLPLAFATAVTACSLSPRSDLSRFYVLSAEAEVADPEPDPIAVSVGVEMASGPDYLDRSVVVFRKGPNEVGFSEFDRWAEPLDKALVKTVANNLGLLLGTDEVFSHPWPRSARPDYRVTIDVLRFESDTTGAAELWASWTVLGSSGSESLRDGETHVSEPSEGAGTAASVAAMSRTLGALSGEIAAAIRAAYRAAS